MKFVADSMLGKLARWLRILGFDTLYCTGIEKSKLVEMARRDGRVLLTRNTRLTKRGLDVQRLFIKSDHRREQLEEVLKALDLAKEAKPFTRCLECNEPLKPIDKEDARGRVPDFVFHEQEEFSLCRVCGRIYWKGSHHQAMRRALEERA